MFLGKFLEMGEYDKHFYGTSLDRFVSYIFPCMMMIIAVFSWGQKDINEQVTIHC